MKKLPGQKKLRLSTSIILLHLNNNLLFPPEKIWIFCYLVEICLPLIRGECLGYELSSTPQDMDQMSPELIIIIIDDNDHNGNNTLMNSDGLSERSPKKDCCYWWPVASAETRVVGAMGAGLAQCMMGACLAQCMMGAGLAQCMLRAFCSKRFSPPTPKIQKLIWFVVIHFHL